MVARGQWFIGLVFIALILSCSTASAATRGISLNIKQPDGQLINLPLYKASHALLIGVSDYSAGWPDLMSVPAELAQLKTELERQGFSVQTVVSPTGRELTAAYEDFIDTYGYDRESRLLMFFSGHGYSRSKGTKGYLVPADAPDPRKDEKGFLRKAINMDQIMTWARQIESKHAMFMFDSCFSGTVFKTKALPKYPPHISDATTRPVRQFISAGSAGEEVPAKSIFVPTLLRALEGEGDLDADGYVTGTELGMYLHNKVLGYDASQTPQYGKIRDPQLDEGDFVFINPNFASPEEEIDPELARRELERSKRESLWAEVKDSDNSEMLELYVEKYPESDHTALARLKINAMKRQEAADLQARNVEQEKAFWRSAEETRSSEMLEAYLDKYPQGSYVVMARAMVSQLEKQRTRVAADKLEQERIRRGETERQYWASIENLQDSAIYQAYLDKYPAGQFVALAKAKLKRVAQVERPKQQAPEMAFWQSVEKSDNTEMLQSYLDKYPQGLFVAVASLKQKELMTQQQAEIALREKAEQVKLLAAEKQLWDSIENLNDPQAYQAYLDKHPQGQFVALAKAKQRKASEMTLEAEQEKAFWASVEQSNNGQMLQAYLEKYPQGTFVAAAQVRLDQLLLEQKEQADAQDKQAQLRRQDSEKIFWQTVSKSDKPSAYKAYLDKYPSGQFADLARIKKQSFLREASAIPTAVPPKIKLAILPFLNMMVFADTNAVRWHGGTLKDLAEEQNLEGFAHFLAAMPGLKLHASYYQIKEDEDGYYPVSGMDGIKPEVFWDKQGFFSDYQLKVEKVLEVCQKNGSDLAFIGKLTNGKLVFFLLDIRNGKVVKRVERLERYIYEGADIIQKVMRNVLKDYDAQLYTQVRRQ